MSTQQLSNAILKINWQENTNTFLKEFVAVEQLDRSCTRIAMWSRQFELADKGNPALSFIRGLQVGSQHVVACVSLGLYRAAAASIRGIVENGLYYSYFRDHPKELATLVRDHSYYVSRGDLIAHHKTHTEDFKDLQNLVGFIGRLDEWYGKISSVVHGQIPGKWVEHTSLEHIKTNSGTLKIVVDEFSKGEEILHDLFLMTVGRQLWDNFSSTAKKNLLSGVPGPFKTALKLDKG